LGFFGLKTNHLATLVRTGLFSVHHQIKFDPWDARWFVFKPKIPIWVNFGGSCNVSIFYVRLVYFTAIGNTLWPLGKFCGHLVYSLVCCTTKNLATLFDPVKNRDFFQDLPRGGADPGSGKGGHDRIRDQLMDAVDVADGGRENFLTPGDKKCLAFLFPLFRVYSAFTSVAPPPPHTHTL
jgi:hypothetical protein